MAPARTRTGPPDFVGVGTQRSGTTWWFRNLVGHPRIRAPRRRRKELHFFDRFCTRELREEDIERYHDLFPRGPGQIAGEWTPRYMRDVWTPRLLQRAAPEAKLLVLLRDPVERYRSGVPHKLTRAPQRTLEALATDAVERSRYALQLRRLREFFDEERILVLQYEKCRLDPLGQYHRTVRFLGLGTKYQPPDLDRRRGTTMESRKEPLPAQFKEALQTALEPDVRRLRDMVPDVDFALWPNFAHLADEREAQERAPQESKVS